MRWLCARPDPGRTRRGGALPPSSRRSAQPRATDRDTCTGAVLPGPGEARRERRPAPSHTARPSRQGLGRVKRRAARAGRDPAGRGPAPSLSLLGTADSVMAVTHAQGGARPEPGVTRRERALLSPFSLLGTAESDIAATPAQAVCGPRRTGSRRCHRPPRCARP